MIYLYTGVPGAGKTLFCLFDIFKREDRENRPFFIAGMKHLTAEGEAVLKPHYIEPKEWVNCPDGSIVMIDEAQFPMPVRPAGQVPPDWIQDLATHRHKGLDIYLTTQSPMLIDVFVRRLVGKHRHVNRVFGLKTVSIFEWESVQSDPNDYHAKKQAVTTPRPYPKKVFGWYESATIHTHQQKLPKMKLLMLVLFLSAFVGGIFGLFHVWHRLHAPERLAARSVAPGRRVAAARPVPHYLPPVRPASAPPVVSNTGYTVRGSLAMGGRKVYLAEDSHHDTLELSGCKVYQNVVFCHAGGRLLSVPSLDGGGAGEPVYAGGGARRVAQAGPVSVHPFGG